MSTTTNGPTGQAPPRMIWARLAVDPLADPLARALAPVRWVTPNRVTAFAFACALGAAACFLLGELRWGGLLFLVRYFADCLDGKLARLRGTSSPFGALADIAADVLGIHLTSAALAWYLVDSALLDLGWGLGLVASIGCYNWALSHRKQLAERLGLGEGGSAHRWPDVPGLRHWFALCRRIDMAAFPWVLEVEMTVLGLAPLLLAAQWAAPTVIAGTGAWALFTLVNLRRCVHLSRLQHDRAGAA